MNWNFQHVVANTFRSQENLIGSFQKKEWSQTILDLEYDPDAPELWAFLGVAGGQTQITHLATMGLGKEAWGLGMQPIQTCHLTMTLYL